MKPLKIFRNIFYPLKFKITKIWLNNKLPSRGWENTFIKKYLKSSVASGDASSSFKLTASTSISTSKPASGEKKKPSGGIKITISPAKRAASEEKPICHLHSKLKMTNEKYRSCYCQSKKGDRSRKKTSVPKTTTAASFCTGFSACHFRLTLIPNCF